MISKLKGYISLPHQPVKGMDVLTWCQSAQTTMRQLAQRGVEVRPSNASSSPPQKYPFQVYKFTNDDGDLAIKVRTGKLYKGMLPCEDTYDIDYLDTELNLAADTKVRLELLMVSGSFTVDTATIFSDETTNEKLLFTEADPLVQEYACVPIGYVHDGALPAGEKGFNFSLTEGDDSAPYCFIQQIETHLMMAMWTVQGKAVTYPIEAR